MKTEMFCHPCSVVTVLQWVWTVDTRQSSVCQPCLATVSTQCPCWDRGIHKPALQGVGGREPRGGAEVINANSSFR